MKLVIVESPAKTHTIKGYLDEEYKVVSSKGHIRDLATTGKFGLGVDVEGNFDPNYISIPGKKKDISSLKKDVKEASFIYLATDPDREGEAISWHLYDELKIKDDSYERVVFNEITESAVKEAFNNTRKIDMDLVKSQETRRILDRIIGFRLSKQMQKLTRNKCKSAGRVQSVALKLIVDREKEINAFIPVEYWDVVAKFDDFEASLFNYDHKKLEIGSEKEVKDILSKLGDIFTVESIEEKEKVRKGVMPFTTSTLQQACINKFNFNSSKTMQIAQKLYEGIDLGGKSVGLITYMRTDSVRLSNVFTSSAMKYIEKEFGKEYVGVVKKGKKTENVQDAHEAIRPTSIERTPESVKKFLTPDEYKLYKIIYARTLASLMKDAKVLATTIVLDNNNYQFKATGQVLIFDGFLKAYSDYSQSTDTILPDFNKKDKNLKANDIETTQKFTKPVSRYTEATLIEEMEKLGIGRPSTYATIIKTLKDRMYVTLEDKKFIPTEIGVNVTDKLENHYQDVINVEYTANMEEQLDDIANGNIDNVKLLRDFYKKLENLIDSDDTKPDELEVVGKCPLCGSDLVSRTGKYGEFIACSGYPKCKYVESEEKEESEDVKTDITCPKCGDGVFVKKQATRGRNRGGYFYGCSNYPKCKNIVADEPVHELCPKCSSIMLKDKDGNLYCSEKCDEEKAPEIICPKCKKGHIVKREAKRGKNAGNIFYACDNYPRCKNILEGIPLEETCPKCGSFMISVDGKVKCSNCE